MTVSHNTAKLPGKLLEVNNLRIFDRSDPISLAIEKGHVVGLAGLEGHGQQEFIEALAGVREFAGGTVTAYTEGRPIPITSQRRAVRAGIAYVPRDRKTEGIFAGLSVLENFAVASLGARSRWTGVVNNRRILAEYQRYQEALEIKAPSPHAPISTLSGGNQQKVLLARWMALNPNVLLLNDPTRGVDVTTRLKLYEAIRQLVAEGDKTVIILSSQLEEFERIATRVLVFRNGSVFAELSRDEVSSSTIIARMFGRVQHD